MAAFHSARVAGFECPMTVDVPDGFVRLTTTYTHALQVPVIDQFGKPLDSIYAGVVVAEQRDEDNTRHSINSPMSGKGTYEDLVGFTIDRTGGSIVPKDSPRVAEWLSAPVPDLGFPRNVLQQIKVFVGGHLLDPSVSNRRVIGSPRKTIKVEWE
jgi:hypothetical protein